MLLILECHSKWNVIQNGMSIKMECHSKWKVPQIGMLLKPECHTKFKCHSNFNVTQIEDKKD